MNILGPATLIEALSAWGEREARSGKSDILKRGRGDDLPGDECERTIHALAVVLEHVPQLIAGILLGEPIGAHMVEFSPNDVQNLMLYRGQAVTLAWAHEYLSREHPEERQVRQSQPPAPLVCSAQIGSDDRVLAPYVIWDGWHRTADWLTSASPGKIKAYLIRTQNPLVILQQT